MRERLLIMLAKLHTRHPWRVLGAVAAVTLLFAWSASRLERTMRWSDMLPKGHRSTVQFEKVLEEFKSASNTIVVVQGAEEEIKRFAEEAVPLIEGLTDPSDGQPYVQRVDYRLQTGFIREHGLKLIDEDDLSNMKEMFEDPNILPLVRNINNSFEKEYIEKEESISTREKEDGAFYFLDGIEGLIKTLSDKVAGEEVDEERIRRTADRILVGEEYILSYGKDTLLIVVIPTFSMMDMIKGRKSTDGIQAIVDRLTDKYEGITAGLTGMVAVQRDETVYVNKSLGYTSVIASAAVLVLLISAFRMWMAPVYGLITLMIGVIWSVGLATFTVGALNMMTSIFSVILIGLGIDFGIHIISGFTENRAGGEGIEESLSSTFRNAGKGIITGSLTTAVAFFALTIARTRSMKEMGIVLGGGVVAVMLATFFTLPPLLVIREKRKQKRSLPAEVPSGGTDISFVLLGRLASRLASGYRLTAIVVLLVTAFMIYAGSGIKYDTNYLNLEPKGLVSVSLMDEIIEKFSLSVDYGLILAGSVEESRRISDLIKDRPLVASVEDISSYLPSEEEQKKRLGYIKEINRSMRGKKILRFGERELPLFMEELARLEMNIMEMQDMAYLGGQDRVDGKCTRITGDPETGIPPSLIKGLMDRIREDPAAAAAALTDLQDIFSPYFRETVLRMGNEKVITLEDLPDSILQKYCNEERDLFMVTVYPRENIWKAQQIMDRFCEDMSAASPDATGMPVIMNYLIKITAADGKKALVLTVIAVYLLLFIDFSSALYSLIAMVPLVLGTLWMVGLMKLSGMQFTMMNVMGLPLIIGIGIDDGVHVVHRWLVEGKGKVPRIFSSTGKAILLTTLTTMFAFGSLLFSVYRGFASLGGAMFIGVGACFLTTVIVLPAIIAFLDRKR